MPLRAASRQISWDMLNQLFQKLFLIAYNEVLGLNYLCDLVRNLFSKWLPTRHVPYCHEEFLVEFYKSAGINIYLLVRLCAPPCMIQRVEFECYRPFDNSFSIFPSS